MFITQLQDVVFSRKPSLGRLFLVEWDEAAPTCDMTLYTIHIVRVSDLKRTLHYVWFTDIHVWN